MGTPRRGEGTERAARRAAVAGLTAAYLALALTSSREKSPAYDEVAHLTAGCAYWRLDDYRLQPENGNLPQRLAALPVAVSGRYRFPTTSQAAWRSSDVWALADSFCHELGNDLGGMLLRGRAMIAILGAALCLVVHAWARDLFGDRGGLVALLLAALSPTMLAHGQLITSDMAAALFLTLSVRSVWGLLHRATPGRLALGAMVIGALFLSKATAALLVPMAAAMTAVRLSRRGPIVLELGGGRREEVRTRLGRLLVVAAMAAACAAVAAGMVWIAYGLRYSAFAEGTGPGRFYRFGTLAKAAEFAGAPGRLLLWCGSHRLLPESFLYGSAYAFARDWRAAFLDGEYSMTGWRRYFPYCLLVKTPLPLFGLLIASAAWLLRRDGGREEIGPSRGRRAIRYELTPIAALLAVYWAAAIASRLNIGHRHLLPTYPAMFVLAGGSAAWLGRGRRVASATVVGLLGWYVVDSARAYPHYLAYFNEVVGRRGAYRHLVDSNLDWGQDLPGLARWLVEHNPPGARRRPVHLAYFGKGRPEVYGIRAVRLPMLYEREADARPLVAGLYCVGATSLQSLYARHPGRWNRADEARYQTCLAELRRLGVLDPTGCGAVPSGRAEAPSREVRGLLSDYAFLRSARLMAFLRHREPDDEVGYSLLIYELSSDAVRRALTGPPAELDALSWLQRESPAESASPSR